MSFRAAVEKRWYASSAGWLLMFCPLEWLFRSLSNRRKTKITRSTASAIGTSRYRG